MKKINHSTWKYFAKNFKLTCMCSDLLISTEACNLVFFNRLRRSRWVS